MRPVTAPIDRIDPDQAHEVSEYLPDGLITALAPDHAISRMNSLAARILGVERHDILGQPLEEALPLVDLKGRPWWPQASPWVGLPTRSGHREKFLIMPNGREVLVTARYHRLHHLGPVVIILLGVRSAESRRRAEAEHAALVSTLAHELRSPLTGVKGFSSTLLQRWDRFTDEQKLLMLRTIEDDADRVNRLITELLDVSRIDARHVTIHPSRVDVVALFERYVDRLAATGQFVEITQDHSCVEVWCDPDRLEQMMTNIVDNAVRYARSRIHFGCAASPEGMVDLTVEDDGPGVPEDRREYLFRKFAYGRAPGSMGLGLYIVRGLARAHGGSASIEDSDLGGARVRLRLPAVPGEE